MVNNKNIRRILIANRGEIATRIIQTCNKLSIESVLVTSIADQHSLPARLATRSVCIGPAFSRDSYLRPDLIIHAALATKCNALHPGYGFLSEQPELSTLCAENDITFIGPKSDTIKKMGNKLTARTIAQKCNVPVLPISASNKDTSTIKKEVEKLGVPVLIKAAAGGGGRGIKIVRDLADLGFSLSTAASEAEASFGDPSLFVEKFIEDARHIEIQILGDEFGNIIHMGARDCSLQRRFQKVIEESPVTIVPEIVLAEMRKAAIKIGQAVKYTNAGTVEFLFDKASGKFFFLEMNTRLQVEHPVTEMVTGTDIVEQQIHISQGESIVHFENLSATNGHAIEARITAETPLENFRPSPGKITTWHTPNGDGIRVDTYCEKDCVIPPFYDSLIAKIIAHAPTRSDAIKKLSKSLNDLVIEGIDTNINFLLELLKQDSFVGQYHNTRTIDQMLYSHVIR